LLVVTLEVEAPIQVLVVVVLVRLVRHQTSAGLRLLVMEALVLHPQLQVHRLQGVAEAVVETTQAIPLEPVVLEVVEMAKTATLE
jgi:hypothetical protein